MVKIMKQGHLQTRGFICGHCGCEFEADETDYLLEATRSDKAEPLLYKGEEDFKLGRATNPDGHLIYKITEKFSCKCPCCNRMVANETEKYFCPDLQREVKIYR